MTRVRIVVPRSDAKAVVDSLYEFGAIQVTRSREGSADIPLESFDLISRALIELRACERALGLKAAAGRPKQLPALEGLLGEAAGMERDFASLRDFPSRVSSLRTDAAELRRRISELEPLAAMGVSPSLMRGSGKLVFKYFKFQGHPDYFYRLIAHLPCSVGFAGDRSLVACDGRREKALDEALAGKAVPLPIPAVSEAAFADAVAADRQKLAGIEQELAGLEVAVKEFREKRGADVVRVRTLLEEHAKKAELPNKFGRTDYSQIAEGWVPTRNVEKLENAVSSTTGGKVAFERKDFIPGDAGHGHGSHGAHGSGGSGHGSGQGAGHGVVSVDDVPPTKLDNPPMVRRFEFLVKFFSLPNQEEFDPTVFFAITFPFFFGMILGDIGYGLLTIAIGLYLRSKGASQAFRDIGGMMALSGLSATVFGAVFGEFFGTDSLFGLYAMTPLIHRGAHGIELLIGVVLVLAVIHLALGLIIGIATNYARGHAKHAAAKACWLGLELAVAFFGAGSFIPNLIPPVIMTVLGVVAFLAVVGLYVTEGIVGIVEIPTLFANILSYLRVMAIGLSGVILAKIINQIPVGDALAAVFKGGDPAAVVVAIVTFLLFALMLVLGHALSLGLAIFESGIQTLRLHYVEFFSKFYKGGGRPFVPLRESESN